MQGMLDLRQIKYDTAQNGNKAIEMLRAGNIYDVIVMDYNMPGIDGIETIRTIKSFFGNRQSEPVILLYSSSDDIKMHEACQELQINQFYRALTNINLQPAAVVPKLNKDYNAETLNEVMNSNKCTVLIAEDNSFNMKMAKAMLKFIVPDAEVIEAKNGKECIDLFKIHQPDIVLMDIQMPEINGYDATKAIREIDAEIPIIALTAGSISGEREKCIAAGMSDYIAKPFVKDTLHKMLEKWLTAVC
jgi:CheY-like chemotaxis protein